MNKERKETANKGFSLVELIIVVAIMAVLVGILAPQYIKYVEKSRVSADKSMTDEFVKAMQVLASDVDVTLDTSKEYKVTSAADATAIVIDADLTTLLGNSGSVDTSKSYTYKSSAFKAADITISLKYNTTTKVWNVSTKNVPN